MFTSMAQARRVTFVLKERIKLIDLLLQGNLQEQTVCELGERRRDLQAELNGAVNFLQNRRKE